MVTLQVAAAAPAPEIEVTDAWIRWLPADIPAGGYMTLVNTQSSDRILVAVTSKDYGAIGIHQTLEDHGVSKMRPVESVTLTPHAPVRFAEGGYHLMLMQPTHPIHPGDRVIMTLRLNQGPPIDAVFTVRARG
jgi:copper(I)-binding protein